MYVISYVRPEHECETFDEDCRPPIAPPSDCVAADEAMQMVQYFVSGRQEHFECTPNSHAWQAATLKLFECDHEELSELTVYEFAPEDFAETYEDEDEDEDDY